MFSVLSLSRRASHRKWSLPKSQRGFGECLCIGGNLSANTWGMDVGNSWYPCPAIAIENKAHWCERTMLSSEQRRSSLGGHWRLFALASDHDVVASAGLKTGGRSKVPQVNRRATCTNCGDWIFLKFGVSWCMQGRGCCHSSERPHHIILFLFSTGLGWKSHMLFIHFSF